MTTSYEISAADDSLREVSRNESWGPEDIKARGIQLLPIFVAMPETVETKRTAWWGSEDSNHLPAHYGTAPLEDRQQRLQQWAHLRAASIARAKTRPAKRD